MRGNSSMAFINVSFRLKRRDFQRFIIANGRELSNGDLRGTPGFTRGLPSLAIAAAIG